MDTHKQTNKCACTCKTSVVLLDASFTWLFHRSHFPSETVHTLRAHNEEVWFVQFSHNGSHLASGSKDGNIIIWSVQVTVVKQYTHTHTHNIQAA